MWASVPVTKLIRINNGSESVSVAVRLINSKKKVSVSKQLQTD